MVQLDDGGYLSRKFILALVALTLLVTLAIVSNWIPSITGLFSVIVSGIVGILGVYFGANVTSEFAVNRSQKALEKTPPPAKVEETSEEEDEEASA